MLLPLGFELWAKADQLNRYARLGKDESLAHKAL